MAVPNLRIPFTFAGVLTGGQPSLRTPFVFAEPLTGGNPDIRANYLFAEPVTGGNPNLRMPLAFVEALIPVPEDLPVATLVFPQLAPKNRGWDRTKTPVFNTAVRQSTSGRRSATPYMEWPIWSFELNYPFLPDIGHDDALARDTDLRVLTGFFQDCKGRGVAFLYQDLDDHHAVESPIATADGVTLQWPFSALIWGSAQPVGQVDLSAIGSFAATAVNTTTGDIVLAAHGLTTAQGPLFISNAGGSLPTGLAAATPYWPIVVDANTFQLASTYANALAATPIVPSAQGSGTDTLAKGWAVAVALAETHSVPASPAYTVTVTHASTFLADEGVTIGGSPLTKVAGAPAAGQYAVNSATGVYTFNAAQASATAVISYKFRATNVSLTLPNQLVFASAPASGAVITAAFDYYFVCRFKDDSTEFKQFASKLHDLGKLDFDSEPTG